MYGAGNIGRGFIGQLFSQSGYSVGFIDINKEVIARLNQDKEYPVEIVTTEGVVEDVVKNVFGIDGTDIELVSEEIAIPSERTWQKINTKKSGEKYIVKAPVDTTVENGMILAELIDDECSVSSSGEIRYVDVEVDENQIVTKPGNIVFVPEEVHQINKDSNLKMVENGTFVTAGTEVVKDVYTHIDGIVEFKEFNAPGMQCNVSMYET